MAMMNPVLAEFAFPTASNNRFGKAPDFNFFLAMSLGHCPKQWQAIRRRLIG